MLQACLQKAGYATRDAGSVEEAWQELQLHPEDFDAVLLDRIMPGGDGIEVLRRMKKHPQLMRTPVIMQTSLTSQADILEGLRSGAFYYLNKPFSVETLMAIVDTAVNDCRHYRELRLMVKRCAGTFAYLSKAEFSFRTPEEATGIATMLANVHHDPERLVLGLTELMINAIEHGNLGINYSQKTRLLQTGNLIQEIEHRLADPHYSGRIARLNFERDDKEISFLIADQGKGFDWAPYLEITPERALHSHGRGIAMAKMVSFDHVEYIGCGNQVLATVIAKQSDES
jgi:DNA-binding response OmpR family regulator